jgi:hypothetical protein
VDNKINQRWVKALRSGKYPQTDGALRRENSFCCLGVLCDVLGAIWLPDKGLPKFANRFMTDRGEQTQLSFERLNELVLDEKQQAKLINMNDNGISFDEIAGYIEENL